LHKIKWRKAALAFSACLFVLWWALGTGATLAWFSDYDTVRNEFQVGLLNIDVDYRNDIVDVYTPLQGATKAFNDQALYEPGYTQVVYLRIGNQGNVDFRYKLAVTVDHVDKGTGVHGNEIYLPNYLRYGVVFGETEAAVIDQVRERLEARSNAPENMNILGTWSEISPHTFDVENEQYHYAALIVYMPEEVDNAANYRGMDIPRVYLGISVFAQQANAPLEKDP
jgi:predicted ribosomally synthesized peptide with SipW-like signal peptide